MSFPGKEGVGDGIDIVQVFGHPDLFADLNALVAVSITVILEYFIFHIGVQIIPAFLLDGQAGVYARRRLFDG